MNKFALFLKASLLDPLIRSFKRFTEAIVLSVLLVILGIINLETNRALVLLTELLPFLWLTLPLLIFKTLLVERIGLKRLWNYLLSGAALVITVSFYLLMRYVFITTDVINVFRMGIAWIVIIVAALLVQYFPKRENFTYYLVFLMTKIFLTVFYAAVLYGGLFGIFASIEALFGANLSNFIYIDLFIAVIGLVAVPVFVGFIPNLNDEMTEDDYHKVWRTVFAFIIVPLIMIFSAILVFYIITSPANSNYFGLVYLISALVTVFLTLAMNFFLEKFEGDYPHVRFFNKYWPFVMLAILIGFFYELIVALLAQGFTLNTSIYLYAGIALLALSIVRVIKKPLRLGHGQILGVTSIIAGVTVAFIPFVNFLSLTTYSMNNRFEKLLTDLGMLENGEVIHSPDELEEEEKQSISQYVLSFGDIGFNRIRCLPDDFELEDFYEVFGFELDYYTNSERIFLSYGCDEAVVDLGAMNASGYTDFLYVSSVLEEGDGGVYSTTFDDESGVWSLLKNDLAYIDVAFSDVIESFYLEFDVATNYQLDLYTDLKYTPLSDDYDLYVKTIDGAYVTSDDSYLFYSAEFYIGVK